MHSIPVLVLQCLSQIILFSFFQSIIPLSLSFTVSSKSLPSLSLQPILPHDISYPHVSASHHLVLCCFQVQAFTSFPGEVSPTVRRDIKTPGEIKLATAIMMAYIYFSLLLPSNCREKEHIGIHLCSQPNSH